MDIRTLALAKKYTEEAVANASGATDKVIADEVAKIVAGADAQFDTLKEIADWIQNDTTGAAGMANEIQALENLVGNTAVATQITNAINALKLKETYALNADLEALETSHGVVQESLSQLNEKNLLNIYYAWFADRNEVISVNLYIDLILKGDIDWSNLDKYKYGPLQNFYQNGNVFIIVAGSLNPDDLTVTTRNDVFLE
jgi:hypothetical protein